MDFWKFAGEYWWLIFPIMAIGGGYVRRWQTMSRERHQQRLETLRLKSELKSAELAARGRAHDPPTGAFAAAPPVTEPDPASSKGLLKRLFRDHDEITGRWLDYELDAAKMIAFPAMSDGRQPLTAAFLRAKRTADALRPASSEAKLSERQIGEYLDAVGNYAVAFEIAERDARRLRDSTFTEEERKRLERAQHMLKVAVDESATTAERQTAYRRVREELDGLIDLSDAAVETLEKRVALSLEPSAPQPAPSSTTASTTTASASASATEAPQPIPRTQPAPHADPLRPPER